MRATSPGFARAAHAQESEDPLLPLITLSHADWADPIRWVRDENPVTHLGQVYAPAGFEISLPDDVEEGMPVMQWSVDNTDRRLVAALRGADGAVQADVRYVMASTPNIIEAGPFELQLAAAEYDAQVIGGGLTVEPILEEQAGYLTMTPATTPGLF